MSKDDQSPHPHDDGIPILPSHIERATEAKERERKEQESKEDDYKTRQLGIQDAQLAANKKIGAYTLLLAFLTAISIVISYLAVTAASDSANVARDAANIARDTSRLDQRPWLWFDLDFSDTPAKERPSPVLIVGKPIQIPFRIRNTGKTPAGNISGRYLVELVGADDGMLFPENHLSNFKPRGEIANPEIINPDVGSTTIDTGEIFPNTFMYSIAHRVGRRGSDPAPTPLTPTEVSDLNAGAKKAYFVALVAYSDGFGMQHWTQFCRGISNPRLTQSKLNRRCGEYNRSDASAK